MDRRPAGHHAPTNGVLLSACGHVFCTAAAIGSGLLIAWITSYVLARQAITAAMQQNLVGLAFLALAGLLIVYRIHETCGICGAARSLYTWLGEGEVEVDG